MATVLITSEYFAKFSAEGYDLLTAAGHQVIENPYGHTLLTPEQIIPHIHDADAIICDLEKITREVLDAAPHLRLIARRGVGVDSVDYDYAAARGIQVARTLGAVEAPVAELVMSYILEFSRKISVMSRLMHQNAWEKYLGSSVEGKVLGIVGMGKIGTETAKRAHAFGMKIQYTDIRPNPAADAAFDTERVPLSGLLEKSDFVSLHLPLSGETRHIIGYPELCLMKPDSILINTARGTIVEETGLVRALKEKRIGGAAVDVYDVEPQTTSPLRQFENVLLTPHIATFTREVFVKMDVLAAQNVIHAFS